MEKKSRKSVYFNPEIISLQKSLKKNKEISQAKHIAGSAVMRSGVN